VCLSISIELFEKSIGLIFFCKNPWNEHVLRSCWKLERETFIIICIWMFRVALDNSITCQSNMLVFFDNYVVHRVNGPTYF